MKKIALLFTLFAVLLVCLPVFAQSSTTSVQEPLVLTAEQGEYSLGRHLYILEDPSGELTIEDVSSAEFADRFTPSTADVPIFPYTTSVFWLRLRLRNQSPLTNQWLLESNFQNLNYVNLYIPVEGGNYLVKETGALMPFDTRDVPYYHVVFKLPLAYQADETFYIRVASGSSMTLGFTLWAPETFAVNKISDMLSIGLFYGALLLALGYHLFLLFSLKEINYVYFVLVIASAILFFASYEGVGDQYLWPALSQYKLYFLVTTMALFFMATLKFSDAFLEQKNRTPRIHLLFNLMIGIWGLMIVIMPFLGYHIMAQLTSPLILLTLLFAIAAGIYHWRKGFHQARFYLISWLGFMLGLFALEMTRSGFLPSTPITEKSYHLGMIWLVLMWSLALADRINQLKAETELVNRKLFQSQQELSQTLEALPIGAVVYGPERIPTYTNQRAVDILANPARGIIPGVAGRRTLAEAAEYFSFHVFGSDEVYPVERLPVWQAYEGKNASVDDIEADLGDRQVPLEIWANPVRDEQGKVVSVVAAFQDITERRQTQKELDEYRQQLEQMVSDRTQALSKANEQLQLEITERQRLEEILRMRLEWLVAVNQINQTITQTNDLPEAYRKLTEVILRVVAAKDAFLAEIDIRGKEMKVLAHTCQNTAHPVLTGMVLQLQLNVPGDWNIESGKPIVLNRDEFRDVDGVLNSHYQHTQSQFFIIVPQQLGEGILGLLGLEFPESERLFSVNEIALLERICLDIAQVRAKARISEQSQALIATEERSRLARDLHDSVTQVLFAASLVAEVLPQIWRRNPDKAQASLEELRRLSRGALSEMRTLLLELRPAALINTPLADLLTQLTEAVTSRAGLSFELFLEQTPPLPEDVHIGFYRIAQESLNNVVKHAKASQVEVSLIIDPQIPDTDEPWKGELKLIVQDNGRGFSEQDRGPQQLGLAIMHERAKTIQATLSVESRPGQGTTVTLTWHT